MALLTARAAPQPASETSLAREIVDGIALTDTLPEALTQDATGRRFEPVQLNPQADLLRQLALLLRRDPIGGGEQLIHENGRRLRELGLVQLNRTLAGTTEGLRPLIDETLAETRVRKGRLEDHKDRLVQTYARLQERLHRWQDHADQRSGSLGADVWRWLVGGDERLALPQVVALWNERERQALQRAAYAEALDIASWLLDTLGDLGNRLDALLAQAHGLHSALAARHAQLRNTAAFAPWTLRLDSHAIAEALAAQANLGSLVAEVLRRQTEGAGATVELADQIEQTARLEARRLLEGLTIVDLIELETGVVSAADGVDPVILVGQELLDRLARPIWQLVRGARPRVETVQVTPQGAPVYSLDGLASASYGAALDRLGFVQVQLGLAKDELASLGDEATFQDALRQRNLFVLDELAERWENEQAAVDSSVSVNGQEPQPGAGMPLTELPVAWEGGDATQPA